VKQIDLLTYLQNYEPESLIKHSGSEYCLREHDSLKISNGMWHWHSQGIGGKTALDFLIHVRGYDFKGAVILLSEKSIPDMRDMVDVREAIRKYNTEKKQFSLPSPYSDNERAIAYLQERGIAKEIVQTCIDRAILYEDIYHNAVFVGMDDHYNARYAMRRGTLGMDFKRECTGSDKRFAFTLLSEWKTPPLIVTESAIDALSIATLHMRESLDWTVPDILSLGGIGAKNKLPVALEHFLENHPKPAYIYLCLDNDNPGREAAARICDILRNDHGIIYQPPKKGKDYNEYIMGRPLNEQATLSR
jgi:hypothetical protein